ncbi:MAG: cytochrome b/b6 domain-containing protein [Burkholderiales bacterium]|nr:cytochrome b/b6 domain-containing protein [Burkholderiales bacterium]
MAPNAALRWNATAMTLHWLTVIVVLVAFAYGPGGSENRVYDASRDFERQLHESLGLIVLGLTLLRLVWRFAAARPASPPSPRWMTIAAKAVQVALYVLLLALPATAATGAWLEGHPLTLLAGVRIGPLLTESHALGATIAEVHGWLGDAIMWLAGAHAAAALWHHLVLRDGVLASMLPGWMPLRRPR